MWFKREQRNRRLHRQQVLDVKLRSDQVRASRIRTGMISLLGVTGTVFGIYLLYCIGNFGLNVFVYKNPDFAIQRVDIKTDGVIAPEQLRRWSGVKPGANLIRLDLGEVKRNLEMVSVIDSVSVERVLPSTLKIRVTERQPVAQINLSGSDANGGVAIKVLQMDAGGMVMQPLDPRLSTVPLLQLKSQLPVITGENPYQIVSGQRTDQPQVLAALRLVAAFNKSPMAGLADLRYVDVSGLGVLVAATGQGSQITFGLDDPDRQLRRWRQIYDYGRSRQESIAAANLAVANNVPVHYLNLAATAPVPPTKVVKPFKPRRKNV